MVYCFSDANPYAEGCQKGCPDQGKEDFISSEGTPAAGNVLPGTYAHTFVALEAVSHYLQGLFLQKLQIRRAVSRAGAAAFYAGFFFPSQCKKGKDGEKRKDCSQRAKHLAEKSLLNKHSHQDKPQQHTACPIPSQLQIPRMKLCEHIPGTDSSSFVVDSRKAQQQNSSQNQILYDGQGLHDFAADPFGLCTSDPADCCMKGINPVAQTSKGASVTAEKLSK